jgi:type II secretory pathway pseudopilin PulG
MKALLHISILLLVTLRVACAWSSGASRTDNDLRSLAGSIESYRMETGRLPSPEQYWMELHRGGFLDPSKSGPPLDAWSRPFIYRMPGKHGDFDLLSYGQDGIDQDGGLDDISSWAGVNDGFHWKATWPRGRFTIALSIVLGFGSLLLICRYPWGIMVPIAVSIMSAGVLLGCQWLMHPGVVRSRNGPLVTTSIIAFCVLALMLAVLTLNVGKRTRKR